MPRDENCPEHIYELMLRMWHRDPLKRITFQEILDTFIQWTTSKEELVPSNFESIKNYNEESKYQLTIEVKSIPKEDENTSYSKFQTE